MKYMKYSIRLWLQYLGIAALLLALPFGLPGQKPRPPKQAGSPQAASVLILVNGAVPSMKGTEGMGASEWVGASYAARRGVPQDNILKLNIPNTEDPFAWDSWHISWETFDRYMRQPVLKKLRSRKSDVPIRYIVTAWGIPSHLNDVPGVSVDGGWSIDSFLASLESGRIGITLANPYLSRRESNPHIENWQNPLGWPMYLVTRLDGPTPQIAVGLVDKAMRAEVNLKRESGIGYFDYRHVSCCDIYHTSDQTVLRADELARAQGFRTVLNDQAAGKGMIQRGPDTLWAWGWYSGPTTNDVYTFVEGAVGAQLTSYTADGIRGPRPGAWVELWLRRGITATWGATREPTLLGYANADDFFRHFFAGYNFAESAYQAAPALNHTMVFIGDPLYAPAMFRAK